MARERRVRARAWSVLAAAALVALLGGTAVAGHWAANGWRDEHRGYPRRPYGYRGIVRTFGAPCNARTDYNSMYLRAADNGHYYRIRFHKKLGGKGTAFVPERGGRSTNLDNDVRGHIANGHLDRYLRSGIWGYLCRYIAGTTRYSTHAWGIAVDVSAVDEPNGQCHSTVNRHHAHIWKGHRWKWGRAWCDPMHFQYAAGY